MNNCSDWHLDGVSESGKLSEHGAKEQAQDLWTNAIHFYYLFLFNHFNHPVPVSASRKGL